jgi:hypothetical protein
MTMARPDSSAQDRHEASAALAAELGAPPRPTGHTQGYFVRDQCDRATATAVLRIAVSETTTAMTRT